MNKAERHRTIIRLLESTNEDNLISTATLAERFGVSEMTIRRDLQELADEGLVSRQRGGATGLRSTRLGDSNQNKLVGIILVSRDQKFADPFFNVVLEGIDNKLLERGYEIAFIRTHNEVAPQEQASILLKTHPVAGLVLVGTHTPESIPYIIEHVPFLVSVPDMLSVDYDTVAFDGERGICSMVDHLVGLGYRRLGYIAGHIGTRADGYWKGVKKHKLPQDTRLFLNMNDWTPSAGAKGARRLMSLDKPPDAIVCASDRLAIGAIQWAHQNGYNVPRDIAIVGFDDIADSGFTVPPLTTVHVYKHQLGLIAAERLVHRIENPGSIPLQITTPTYLVIRESCGVKLRK